MSNRLPIEDLYFYADIVLTLVGGGRPPTTNVDFETWFTHQNVNKYGIDPDYCPGATADDRLTELQNEPYEMGHFRNYGHDPDPIDFNYKIYIINNSSYSSSNIGVVGDFDIKKDNPLDPIYDTVSLDVKGQGVDSPIERNYEDIVVGTYYIDFSDLNIQYKKEGDWHSEPPVKYEWWFSGLSSPTEGTETDDFEILGDGVTTEPNTIVMRLTFRTTTTTTTAPTTTTTTVAPTTTTTTTTTVAPTTTTTTTTTVAPTTTTTPEPELFYVIFDIKITDSNGHEITTSNHPEAENYSILGDIICYDLDDNEIDTYEVNSYGELEYNGFICDLYDNENYILDFSDLWVDGSDIADFSGTRYWRFGNTGDFNLANETDSFNDSISVEIQLRLNISI